MLSGVVESQGCRLDAAWSGATRDQGGAQAEGWQAAGMGLSREATLPSHHA